MGCKLIIYYLKFNMRAAEPALTIGRFLFHGYVFRKPSYSLHVEYAEIILRGINNVYQ